MIDPTTPGRPDPIRVHRGAMALNTALRLSTLLPREQEAIFSVLRSLNAADEQLRRQAGQPDSDAYLASLLATMLDNYRRELASLGRSPS
jgi:hypothetical protein